MSEVKVVSEIVRIDCPIMDVYSFLSDFNKIGRMVEMARQMGVGNQMPQMDKIADKIEGYRFTDEACYIKLKGMGELALKIVEREEPKLIKLSGDGGMPIEYNLWLQFLEKGPYDTRVRITFHGEMNMMLKMMLKGKLEKGINQLAEGLTKIPYSMLK